MGRLVGCTTAVVGEGVTVGSGDGVRLGVVDGVAVAVGLGVQVGVCVALGDAVGVGVGLGVVVGVVVGVGVRVSACVAACAVMVPISEVANNAAAVGVLASDTSRGRRARNHTPVNILTTSTATSANPQPVGI